MGINFDNFLGGLAFGMLANNPFFRGFGGFCCCGFGGGYSNVDIVDFGTFANGLPYVPNSNYTERPQLFTSFANPFPSIDFSNVCKSIWDNAIDPNSEQNKRLYDMYKQTNEQQSKSSSNTTYIPQIQFPFSSFYMPTQITMNPYINGYYGDCFIPSGTAQGNKTKVNDLSPTETDADTFKDNKKTNNSQSYISSDSNDKYFSKMLSFVFDHEGGEVNHKHDRGGHTNMGVTQGTYDGYRKLKNLPKKNVKYITKDEATEIYKMSYKESGADKITNPRLAMCVFDWANHSGPKNERLQKALKECNGDVDKFIELRSKFLKDLIAKDPTQEDFEDGWNNRIKDLSEFVKGLPEVYS